MAINPNDPVVTILQQAVTGMRKEMSDFEDEVGQALKMAMEGFGQHLAALASRIAVIEARIGPPPKLIPTPDHQGGKEL